MHRIRCAHAVAPFCTRLCLCRVLYASCPIAIRLFPSPSVLHSERRHSRTVRRRQPSQAMRAVSLQRTTSPRGASHRPPRLTLRTHLLRSPSLPAPPPLPLHPPPPRHVCSHSRYRRGPARAAAHEEHRRRRGPAARRPPHRALVSTAGELRTAHCARSLARAALRACPCATHCVLTVCVRMRVPPSASVCQKHTARDAFMLPLGYASCRVVRGDAPPCIRRVGGVLQLNGAGRRRLAIDRSMISMTVDLDDAMQVMPHGSAAIRQTKFKHQSFYTNDASFDRLRSGLQLVSPHAHAAHTARASLQRRAPSATPALTPLPLLLCCVPSADPQHPRAVRVGSAHHQAGHAL